MIYYLYSEEDSASSELTKELMKQLPGKVNVDTSDIKPEDIRIIILVQDPSKAIRNAQESGSEKDLFITNNKGPHTTIVEEIVLYPARMLYVNSTEPMPELTEAVIRKVFEYYPELREKDTLNLS